MKRSVKRYLAMLLVMTLVLQQGSAMGALAGETEPTSETVAEKTTEAQAAESVKKADEKKEEPKQTETQATETQATETQAPETKAEEKKASETQASEPKQEETKAPETQLPEDTKPEGTSPEDSQTETQMAEPESSIEKVTEQGTESEAMTEAPAETTEPASEPETEKETKAEKETEAESSKETEAGPTLLKAECGGVGVSVSAAPGVLKAGTTLEMVPTGKNQVYQTVLPLMDENTEIDKSNFLAYDITLKLDGQEVQPDGEVTVSFTNVPFTAGANEEIVVAHLMDAPAEISAVNTISAFRAISGATSAEIASGLSMKTTHFSIFAVFRKHYYELMSESDPGKKEQSQQTAQKFESDKDRAPLPEKYESQTQFQWPVPDDIDDETREKIEAALKSPAFDFHIFSDEATINQHTNGNIATNKFHGDGKNFGTNQNGEDGVTEFNYFGGTVDGFGQMTKSSTTVLGKDIDVRYEGESRELYIDGKNETGESKKDGTKQPEEVAKNIYQEEEDDKFIDITKELDNLSKLSKAMAEAGRTSSTGVKCESKGSDQADVRVSGSEKINYWNVTAKELAEYKNLHIRGLDGKTLIINVDMTDADENTLANFSAVIEDLSNGETLVRQDCNILWNFYTKKDGVIETYKGNGGSYTSVGNGNGFMGTILAPDANIQYGAVNGSIIARKTNQNGNESHKMTFTGLSATLTVTKTLEDPDETSEKTFYFMLFTDSAGTTPVPGLHRREVKVSKDKPGTTTFSGLKAGTTYYLFETDASGKPLTGSNPYVITGNGQSITIDKDGTDVDASVVNTKPQEGKGTLTVTKTVTGALTAGKLTEDQKKAITFKVTGPNGYEEEFTYAEMSGGSKTFTNLDPGEYTVTETNGNVEGYTVETTYSVAEGKTKVAAGKGAAVTVTNTYSDTKGKLKVKKVFAGDLTAGDLTEEQKGAITFTVTGPNDYSSVFSYADMLNGVKMLEGLEPGDYTVTETNANVDGYTVETTYSVESGNVTIVAGNTAEVTVTNTYTQKKGSLEVIKTVTGLTEELTEEQKKAITFEVTGPNGYKQTFSYADMTGGRRTLTDLVPGTYIVRETNGLVSGYTVKTTYSVAAGNATVVGGEKTTVTITNTYTAAKVSVTFGGTKHIEDVDSTDKTFTFELYEAEDDSFDISGKTAEQEVSTSGTITKEDGQAYSFDVIPYNKAGTYYYVVKEKAVGNNGFILDETVYHITVKIENDSSTGELTVNTSVTTDKGEKVDSIKTLDFTNKAATTKFSLEASKEMADPKTAVGNYEFEVTDASGKVLATAKNDAAGKVVFADFVTYTLSDIDKTFIYTVKEKIPTTPNGTIYDKTVYTVTVSVTADGTTGAPKAEKTEVKKDGSAITPMDIKFVNDVTHLSILKVDESGKALAGAKLVVKDKDGKAAAGPWTTDGKAHEITGLPVGSYVLSEVEAPAGYDVSADVPFEITGEEAAGAVKTVRMTDKKTPEENQNALTITKYVRVQGITSDIGVKDATFYVALFSDEARTKRVSSVKKIEFKNTTASSVTFDKLAAGTYYVSETDENGTPINTGMMGGKVFRPEYPGSMQFTFEGRADTKVGEFTNVFREFPDNFYLAGQLTVTKKVLLNGEEGTSNDTFYARVFKDAALTAPVDDQIMVLSMAGGSTTSATVTNLPIGDTPGSSMTYYVAETDVNGIPLDPSAVEFEIWVDKSEIVLSGANPNGEVVITNSFTEEEESEFESEFESEEESETEVEKKTAPKTGDDTDYMRYLLLMAFSAGLCGVAIGQKRRKAKRVRK